MRSFTHRLVRVLFRTISLCSLVTSYEVRSINTAWGVVRGELVHPDGADLAPVTQFLGVPYGVAPSGQFRFNMAISAAKWTHLPKEARRLSPACIQTQLPELSETRAFKQMSAQRFDYVHRLLPKLKLQSEDCLYMNLFVPERLESSHRDSPLPVLVVVHGDEYGWNAGSPYNGSILASHGQIVVVTLNYRLGVFGFLGRCESSSCSGNSGISDLVSALTMLNVVLPPFGGDPKAVTLLGWGSGASLVSLLMASPLTQPGRRLFRRAILLDGTALAPWAMAHNPQQYFAQVAENLGCLSKNRSSIYNDQVDTTLRCMQDHSADNVTKAVHAITIPTFLSGFAPIVDGQLIPNSPRISFSSQYGSLFREIDLLVGFSSNPAHYLLSNEDLKSGLSKERRQKIFRTLVRNLYDYHRTELLAAIINEYTDWENPRDHPKSIRNGVLAVLNDVLFTAPLIETLRMHSADEVRKEASTFMFVFGHETRSWMNEQPNSGLRGSLTGDHIPYIFGYPLAGGDSEEKLYAGFSAEDRGISQVMMHYVANFVKSGDPSKPAMMRKSFPMGDAFHSTAWPQFDQPNREAYLEITDRPRVKNYYRNARVGFWTSLVPAIHSAGRDGGDVPVEHHLLPDHFRKDTFFGRVRSFAPFANHPFPAPPMPPSPPPENLKKTTTMKPPTVTPSPPIDNSAVATSQYSTMLSVTVAVGCGLLFLNICVFFGLYRQCDKNKRSKKKLQLQYQTYASNQASVPEQYNTLNSPLSLMPPPPPPITLSSSAMHSVPVNDEMFERPMFAPTPLSSGGAADSVSSNVIPRHSFQEQEPLLSASHKAVRAGVSPSCPRHGRAVLSLHPSRGSLTSSGNAPTLEEIQV
uniref:COesterase domain-containing protein n=1 Tax=Haemonchus contortus TaxID=6289 RepID=A0A7I5EEG8_HAECO|nr:Carboxylesterase domain containing protein [Haemonchus contortus]